VHPAECGREWCAPHPVYTPPLTPLAVSVSVLSAGPSQCDRRRPLSETRAAFPGVDFSLVEHEDDVMWETQHVESESAVVARGMKFMQVGRVCGWVLAYLLGRQACTFLREGCPRLGLSAVRLAGLLGFKGGQQYVVVAAGLKVGGLKVGTPVWLSVCAWSTCRWFWCVSWLSP